MTVQPEPESGARNVPTNQAGPPLEYAAPSVRMGRQAPLGSITAFAEGTFLTGLLLIALLIVGERVVSGILPGAACATIGAALSATVIGSIVLFVALKLRERQI